MDIRTKALPEGLGPVSTYELADQLVANPTGTSPLVDRLDGRQQSEGERTEAQGTIGTRVATDTGGYPANDTLSGNGETETSESLTQAAFWQLLKDVGYDTW